MNKVVHIVLGGLAGLALGFGVTVVVGFLFLTSIAGSGIEYGPFVLIELGGVVLGLILMVVFACSAAGRQRPDQWQDMEWGAIFGAVAGPVVFVLFVTVQSAIWLSKGHGGITLAGLLKGMLSGEGLLTVLFTATLGALIGADAADRFFYGQRPAPPAPRVSRGPRGPVGPRVPRAGARS